MSPVDELRQTLVGTWRSETTWGLFRRQQGTGLRALTSHPAPAATNAMTDSSDEIVYVLADNGRYERTEEPTEFLQKLVSKAMFDSLKGAWQVVPQPVGPPLLVLDCNDMVPRAVPVLHQFLMRPSLRLSRKLLARIAEPPGKYGTPTSVERYEIARIDDNTLQMTLAGFELAVTWRRVQGPHLRS
jgi:hypothetical protein